MGWPSVLFLFFFFPVSTLKMSCQFPVICITEIYILLVFLWVLTSVIDVFKHFREICVHISFPLELQFQYCYSIQYFSTVFESPCLPVFWSMNMTSLSIYLGLWFLWPIFFSFQYTYLIPHLSDFSLDFPWIPGHLIFSDAIRYVFSLSSFSLLILCLCLSLHSFCL